MVTDAERSVPVWSVPLTLDDVYPFCQRHKGGKVDAVGMGEERAGRGGITRLAGFNSQLQPFEVRIERPFDDDPASGDGRAVNRSGDGDSV